VSETSFKQKLRQAHATTLSGAQAIVEVLADHEPQYMSVSLGTIDGAASRLENAARQLRDLAAIQRAAKEQ
jgi:flagellar basal body rod protein FlgF